MPEEGVPLQHEDKILKTDEIVELAKIFVKQGVRKIRLTGGEPTIRKDIVEIVTRLGQIPGVEELCLTSNGIALHRKLPKLAQAGLTAVNLSLDTLVEGKFVMITRRNGLQNVMKSLETALQLGIPKVKLNVVVIKGLNDDEILKFVRLAQHYPLEIRFIEYMPFDGNKWELDKVMSFSAIMDIIRSEYPVVNRQTHKYGETSKVFDIPGFQGRIGFISSMTDDFCADCTRLRLTSDGNLKVCLFDNGEVSLRDMLRSNASEDEILNVIGRAVKGKKEKHADLDELHLQKNRPMTLIGG
ncbi:Molybdenum cofactor biosynthesis protein 1 [Cyberlindnera fabianii]|nr:Molybdenum cofactor biosynthesis protein 1 [Cyberlindnera fabianii]